MDEVRNLGGGDEHLRRIETDSSLRKKVAQLLVGVAETATATLTMIVDCTKSLAEMIAVGKYDDFGVDKRIIHEHFPIRSKEVVERELHLVHLNRVMSTQEVEVELDCLGLKPAAIEDLLALGAAHPELQREFPIVAIGSRWRRWGSGDLVPVLSGNVRCRGIGLMRLENEWRNEDERRADDWEERDRFLAVRK